MRRYTKRNKNGEKLNFWLSYSDMMAALLLVFILILSCTLLETRATYEAKQAELEEKEQIILSQQRAAGIFQPNQGHNHLVAGIAETGIGNYSHRAPADKQRPENQPAPRALKS